MLKEIIEKTKKDYLPIFSSKKAKGQEFVSKEEDIQNDKRDGNKVMKLVKMFTNLPKEERALIKDPFVMEKFLAVIN